MTIANSTVPVTVLTGFLGSGKTTLLNRILSENHGKRIAVIENEFGEIGVDNDLVIASEEEIFEMNNGCICCNVRGDLIRILGNLMKRRDKFDHIMIETTGMADPGPVAQTFFMDDEMREAFNLDGVVTLIDAKHVLLHIDDGDEVKEQIAFADVILLNKVDLVSPKELDQLEDRIQSMNPTAKIHRTQDAVVDMDKVLDIGGFDLNRAIEEDPNFTRHYRQDHPHDNEITSVGITTPGELNPEEFHSWMHDLLDTKGPDIFRMKGILSFSGTKERYVFQGVHMLFDGRIDRPWREGERANSLVFIGRNLNREVLNAGFSACLT
ncbi:MAG: cobalamin biosynthesis protein CobW [Blastopirellula sp.]|nr:cobalamin biosynthesis protein CobW [Blastopirellula sp.]